MKPIVLLALIGGGYIIAKSGKKSSGTSIIPPGVRGPTAEEKERGYYLPDCKNFIILNKEKAYKYAYDLGFSPDTTAENIKEKLQSLFYDCVKFDDKDKESEEKDVTQAEFNKLIPSLQFIINLFGYAFLGFIEAGKAPTKQGYLGLDQLQDKFKESLLQKYKDVDTSKVQFITPKGFYFDKDCKLVVQDKQKSFRYFYNIGKNVFPYLQDSVDVNLFLFNNCFILYDENPDFVPKVDNLLKLSNENIKFIYDAIRYLLAGDLERYKTEKTNEDEIEDIKDEDVSHLNYIKSIVKEQKKINTDSWSTEFPKAPV